MELEVENQILEVLSQQRKSVNRLRNSSVSARINQLKLLKKYILDHEKEICDAMYLDFKKPASEVLIAEILGIKHEIDHIISNLSSWLKPKSVPTPLIMLGTKAYIQFEAKGMCLIIAPWNYPLNLAICPMALAIAAGNAVVLKPSELTPHVAAFMSKMINYLYDKSEICVFEGDAEVATFLLEQKFDHVFFTGSPAIGKMVMKAASKHLTSVTLELGGKSPAIIHESCDLQASANKIAWGKFLNNGQTCIAPDYLYVQESVYFRFLESLIQSIKSFYGEELERMVDSKDYARIVNERHFKRVSNLLEDALAQGATLEFGGVQRVEDNYLSPTIVSNVTDSMQLMIEEIFGPILPIKTFVNEDEIIRYLDGQEKALAMYVFSKNNEFTDYLLANTSAGTTVINDCLIQFGHQELPFGGVNHSGIGKSSGHFGFLEFSNQRSVLVQRTNFLKMIYPPYTLRVKWLIKQMINWF